MTCPECGSPIEPFTLTDEQPQGRAESGACVACFTAIEWAREDHRRHVAIEQRAFAPIAPFVRAW